MNDISILGLFWIFFQIGLFAIGGGLVAITMMKQAIVDRGLISSESFYNMVAIAESTPGPVGINMATYIGNEFYGPLGAIIVTIGEVLPSFITILLICKFLTRFAEKDIVKGALAGIRPSTTGLVFVAAINIILLALFNLPSSISELSSLESVKLLFNWTPIAFYILLLWIRTVKRIHPIYMIIAGGVFGYLFL